MSEDFKGKVDESDWVMWDDPAPKRLSPEAQQRAEEIMAAWFVGLDPPPAVFGFRKPRDYTEEIERMDDLYP